jgi:hypothetical protein
MIYAFRFKRWWLRTFGDPRGPHAPSPFFLEADAYPIAKAIRLANPEMQRWPKSQS